jgi:hypothetical protein
MIKEVVTSKGTPAITSDQWHVVHSRYADGRQERPFARAVHSEHASRSECVQAARALRRKLSAGSQSVPAAERDEVFVRRPNFKSLKLARVRRPTPE